MSITVYKYGGNEMTTLKALLELPSFSNIQVLNKQADLSRQIDTIEITETPDVS